MMVGGAFVYAVFDTNFSNQGVLLTFQIKKSEWKLRRPKFEPSIFMQMCI